MLRLENEVASAAKRQKITDIIIKHFKKVVSFVYGKCFREYSGYYGQYSIKVICKQLQYLALPPHKAEV